MSMPTTMLALLRRAKSTSLSDSDLLAQYIRHQDADAFRAIVERHGSMVQAVCRRGVRNAADVDDLFQAAFLLLAKSANRIRHSHALASWLHGTARRLVLQWQKQQYRQIPASPQLFTTDPLAEASWHEVRQILDDELAKLPLRLRTSLVHCYLEGLNGNEAADRLGISLRTLRRDLDRGRVLLRERLAQRGFTPLVLVTALTVSSGLQALPPSKLIEATLTQWSCWHAGLPLAASVQAVLATSGASFIGPLMSLVLLTGLTTLIFYWTNHAATPLPSPVSSSPNTNQQPAARLDAFGDPLPAGILARLGTIRFRHGSPVYSMAFSHDNQRLYTGANDGTLRCSAFPSGKVLWSVTMPNVAKNGFEAVVALAVSADDDKIAASAMNDTTVLYNAHTGKELKRLGNGRDRSSWLGFSSDGKSLYALNTTQATSVREYDLVSGGTISKAELADCYDETANIRNIHFAVGRMQDRVVLADLKNNLVVFNLKTKQVERRVAQHPHPVEAVVWSEDGNAWLSLDAENTLRQWNATTAKLVWKQTVSAVAGRRMLAIAGQGDNARAILATGRDLQFLNPKTGVLEQSISKRLMNYSLAFSHDNKVMAAAGPYGDLCFFDFQTIQPLRKIPESSIKNGLISCDYSPDSRQLVTGGVYDDINVWDVAKGRLLDHLTMKGKACFLGRNHVVTAGWNTGGLALWTLGPPQKQLAFDDALLTKQKGIRALAVVAGGKQVLVGAWDNPSLSTWDIASGKMVKSYDEIKAGVINLACSADGKWIAVNDFNNQLTICQAESGVRVHQQPIPGGQGGSVVFSPDSKLLAWSAGDQKIHITDTASWTDRVIIENRGGPLDAMTFSADGRSLLWGGQHWPTIFVYDVHTGQERTQWRDHLGAIKYLCFAPDGHSFASASEDATVLLRDWHQYHARQGQADLPLSDDHRNELFKQLLGNDAQKSWNALERLLQSPTQSLQWIEQHLRQVPDISKQKVDQWINEFDSPSFEVRDQAMRLLREHLEHSEPQLRQVLAGRQKVESKRRAGELLDEWQRAFVLKDRLGELLELLDSPLALRKTQELAQCRLTLP